MTLAIDKESSLPLRLDESGAIRVGESSVTLDAIVNAFNLGDAAEGIAENYPSIRLADVYATIGYYLHHREEIDRYLNERRMKAEALRREIESQPDYGELRKRLLERARDRGIRP